mgnify:CR=1 FL=1
MGGRVGVFPDNFVELLQEEEPPAPVVRIVPYLLSSLIFEISVHVSYIVFLYSIQCCCFGKVFRY